MKSIYPRETFILGEKQYRLVMNEEVNAGNISSYTHKVQIYW